MQRAFPDGLILAHTLVIAYKCAGVFFVETSKVDKTLNFFPKSCHKHNVTTLTKQKLLLGAKNGGEQRIKMTREEIISMLSTELDEKWDNGITCLMVEDSDAYIPVIVHHQKDGLIVEVEEQDKKIYQIGRNELNKTS